MAVIKFSPHFCYIETKTLTGRKIIAGDRATNSSLQVKQQERQRFLELYALIEEGNIERFEDIPEDKAAMARELERRGYFNDDITPAAMFNEYNHFAKILVKKEFKYIETQPLDNIVVNIFCFVFLALLCAFIFMTPAVFALKIDYIDLSIPEIIFCGTILPCFVFGIHELGHWIIAKILRIPVATACAGFFIIYPTAFLTYRGININKTFNRITILIGGAGGHIIGIFIGAVLLRSGMDNLILQIWIIVNISMIYSNLVPMNISDGYFICSSLLGIYNLRLLGYKALNNWMHRRRSLPTETACGLALLVIWIVSFGGIYGVIDLYIDFFKISPLVVYVVYPVFVVSQLIRFVIRIYKLDNNQPTKGSQPVTGDNQPMTEDSPPVDKDAPSVEPVV